MEDQSEFDRDRLLPDKWFPAETETDAAKDANAGRRAVIYARYSFLGKRESSIERQTEICTSYIALNNYVLVDTYADRQRTGTTKVGREELERLEQDALLDKFDVVVVEEIDRLGRVLEVIVDIYGGLKKLGIQLHDSELGRLTAGQVGAKAGASDEERTKIVKRNREGKRRKIRRGEWVGLTCFGYKRKLVDEKSARTIVEKDEKEAAIVLEIFKLFDEGVSVDDIAAILNARPADDRGNRFWNGHEIRGSGKNGSGFLRRLRYAGISVHGRNSVQKKNGKYKTIANPRQSWAFGPLPTALTIVGRELFERVQLKLNRESRGPHESTWSVRRYPLRGRLYCASCGGKMTPALKRDDNSPRAVCNIVRNKRSVKPGSPGCGNGRSTSIDQIDDMVREILCEEVVHPAALERFVDGYKDHRKLLAEKDARDRPRLERDLKELEAEREDLWKNRDTFGDDFIKPRIANIRSDIAEKKEKLEAIDKAPKTELVFDDEVAEKLVSDIQEVFSPEFAATTATGATAIAKLRKLVKKVVVTLTDDVTSIEIHCDIGFILGKTGSSETIKFSRTRPRTRHSPLHAELRRVDAIVAAGTHALSDVEWAAIAPLLPDCIARSKRGSAAEPRKVIDAALLHLHEGVPMLRMPAAFGDNRAIFSALKRLSASGAWEVVIDVLRSIAPDRVPAKSSDMFNTVKGRYSTALKGLPRIRADHGAEMAAGKHAPTDEEWTLVKDLVPEHVLTVNKERARIEPRSFLHGILYMLKTGTPLSNMPLQIGSQSYFYNSIKRLVSHGFWDRLVKRLEDQSPATLESADVSRFNVYRRSPKERPVFRRSMAKSSDFENIPSHGPSEDEWGLIKHLFPLELLYVDGKLAVDNPRLLAHAILYRVKEKIPYTAFPPFFGDQYLLGLTITKFVFHHLWEEMVAILQERSPATLENADLEVFAKYKRGKTRRYAHLLPAVEPEAPPHAPSDAHWSLVKHLIPADILVVRGKPAIMEPRTFLHAIMFMVREKVQFGGLPKAYFGSPDDVRFAMRKLVRHHNWDEMAGLLAHFDEDWAAKADLTLFDKIARSKNERPEFRKHRARRTRPALSSGETAL